MPSARPEVENAQCLRNLVDELGPGCTFDQAAAAAANEGLTITQAQFRRRKMDLGWIGPTTPAALEEKAERKKAFKYAAGVKDQIRASEETVVKLAETFRDLNWGSGDPGKIVAEIYEAVDILRRHRDELAALERRWGMCWF